MHLALRLGAPGEADAKALVAAAVRVAAREEERLLAASWLVGLCPPAALAPWRGYLYPTALDSLPTQQLKLRLLLHAPHAPTDLLATLACLDGFTAYGTAAAPAGVLFAALAGYRAAFPAELNGPVAERLADAVVAAPRALAPIAALLDRAAATDPAPGFSARARHAIGVRVCALDPPTLAADALSYVAVLTWLCSDPDTAVVVPALRAVAELLRTTSLCARGAWPLGLALLRLVRTALACHPLSVVFGSAKDVLTLLTQTYAHVDIRDQALFLLMVWTHVARDKAVRIVRLIPPLSSSSLSASTAGGTDVDVALGGAGSGTAAAAAPVAAPPKVQSILPFPAPFLTLERVSNNTAITVPVPAVAAAAVLEGPLAAHWALLRAATTTVPSTVHVAIRHQPPEGLAARLPVPARLLSVALELTTAVPTLGRTRLVVPYLEAGEAGASVPEPTQSPALAEAVPFPRGYVLPLTVPLAVPAAAWFSVQATYTTLDGQSHTAPVAPLHVRFADVWVPAADPATPSAAVRRRFDQLWQLLGRGASADDAGPIEAEVLAVDAGLAYEAVKHVPLPAVDVRRLLTHHFGRFRVPPPPDTDTDTAQAEVALWALLPPRHVLLLRCVVGPAATVVAVRSDTWRPLAYVDALLDALVAEASAP
jgi:hypothetical protein